MKKVVLRIVVVMAVLFVGGTAFTAWVMFAPPVSTSRLEQIEIGMTKAEVGSILGDPPNVYTGDDGSEQWVYSRMTWSLLDMTFSADGKLIECKVDW